MCGLAGVLLTGNAALPLRDVVDTMGETLRHRGPDSGNNWVSISNGVGFSHRRLSIVDRSSRGGQPMTSKNQRYVLAYNGEIYNHPELRSRVKRESPGINWAGHSDTETLLECFALWGVEKTLREAVGMFAICLWDSHEKSLTLARDRLGEKPLYFGHQKGIFAFGSELKALKRVPSWNFDINPEAVASYVRYGYVPEPFSIFDNIHKLPPGTFLTVTRSDIADNKIDQATKFWSAVDIAEDGLENPTVFTDSGQAVEALEKVLSQAIKGQLMGDVPVGAFLSGGIDSSAIVALMQQSSPGKIKTFSVGFDDPSYDESIYAAQVAKHLGTDHHELIVSARQAQDVIPKLPEIYDEPFADSSQIPTYLVSELAKSQVSVSLSGDGGDELFGGYNRYVLGAQRWGSISKIPRSIRSAAGSLAQRVSPQTWNRLLSAESSWLPTRFQVRLPGEKIHKAARVLGSRTSRDLYRNLVSVANPLELTLKSKELAMEYRNTWPIDSDLAHQMMALDTISYLPGDILVKVDRASMSHSLESRVPFLDHRVVEFAWKLPISMKIRGSDSKWILRTLLEKYVPATLFERPKMGFGIPLDTWLRGPLREWASELLSPSKMKDQGFFNSNSVQRLWGEHLGGKQNFQHPLWIILMFQAWLASFEKDERGCE